MTARQEWIVGIAVLGVLFSWGFVLGLVLP